MDIDKLDIFKKSKDRVIPPPKEWVFRIKNKLKEYRRVYKITKKPDKAEYSAVVKVTGLGILIVGAIGFSIFLLVELMRWI
jgi:protein transport protein SEC61 subunit gamma and related proteins